MKKQILNKEIHIFGVRVTFSSYENFIDLIFSSELKTFASVNQYFLNIAFVDERFRENLNSFDIIIPDGTGVRLAAQLLANSSLSFEKTTYPDLLSKIFSFSKFHNDTFYFYGGEKKVLARAIKNINNYYPNVRIIGHHEGFNFNDIELIHEINQLKPRFLIVGLGGVVQENWVIKNINKLSVKKILIVGGAFRVFAGDRPRGPMFIRKLGLEWLVRLLYEPKYLWKRYIIGIPLFIYRIIKLKVEYSFSNNFNKAI